MSARFLIAGTRTFAAVALIFLSRAPIAGQELKLIPYPKKLETREGRFLITPRTRVVVTGAHRSEDRIAAEMLVEEIQATTGKKIAVSTGQPAVGTIFLRRLSGKLPSTDPLFKEQGYTLECGKGRIVVAGASAVGLFYGVQTLRQLLVPDGKRLACSAVSILDWPNMRWRGLHDDLSRGPIAKLDFLKKQIRILAEYKMNMLSLYMENVFDYRDHPLLAPKEAAVTPAEATELVKYAAQYYVTIVPEQEAFGHLHNILRNELYTDLAETPHGHVLAPVQPGSYSFIKSMFDELNATFPSPFLHIGADETFELGRGQTKARADEVGLGRVYLEFLQKIAQIMQPYHKRIIFWGDIAMHYPDLLNVLPKDVIADAWAYDARDNFDAMLKPYQDAGLDLLVSPGVNNWSVIFPNLDKAYPNIARFVRDGQKYGALGMLNTNWNDSGESLIGLTWSPTVLGAACSWQQGECSVPQFESAYDWAFYRNQDDTFNEVLTNLNRANSLLRSVGLNQSQDEYLWTDPFTPAGARFTQRALPIAHDLRMAAEKALESIYHSRSRARLHPDTLDPLILAAYRLDFLGMKIQFADEITRYYWDAYEHLADGGAVRRDLREITGTNARLDDLRDATTRGHDMYRDEWLKENHPFWLGNVLLRYDHLANLWQEKILAIKAARQQHSLDKTLPSPEQLGFYRVPAAAPPAVPPVQPTPAAPPPKQ